jgi:citrate lyase beta subunit
LNVPEAPAARRLPLSRITSLCVPGNQSRRHLTALGLPCDEVMLDLEDAVPPDAKAEARELVVATLAQPAWRGRTVAVRINAESLADLEAVASIAGLTGLTVVLSQGRAARTSGLGGRAFS